MLRASLHTEAGVSLTTFKVDPVPQTYGEIFSQDSSHECFDGCTTESSHRPCAHRTLCGRRLVIGFDSKIRMDLPVNAMHLAMGKCIYDLIQPSVLTNRDVARE